MNALQRATLDLIARKQPAAMDAWALERVRGMGKVVLDRTPSAPPIGTTWAPPAYPRTRRWPRHVVAVRDGRVGYIADGIGGSCTLATWHRWVRRTRARPMETNPNPTRAACGAGNGAENAQNRSE